MAVAQIAFFKKNFADISQPNVVASASQASDAAIYALNRNLFSAWMTTDSVDADNTTFDVDFVDERDVSEIILKKHNFKAYTVKYWDGATYQAFTPAISETTNTETTTWHRVTQQTTTKIRITITGTMVANADKYLYGFNATQLIGQLTGWPQIQDPTHSKNPSIDTMLSGKKRVIENIGGFSCNLSVKSWSISADLAIVERLYNSVESFMVWLCGGNEDQFVTQRIGYRLEDLYLVKCTNSYMPKYPEGIYRNGLDLNIKLEEVTE